MKKVLIVENNPVVRKMLSSALEKEGYLVEIAGDGLSAFDKLQSYTPDLIFLDLIMPNINGEQLSHMIDGREDLKDTKIIVISGVAVESRGECDIKGTHACIAKGPHLVRHVIDMANRYTSGNFKFQEHEVVGTNNIYPRETSRELLSANRHLQVVLNHMGEGIIELSRDNRIIFANPAAAQLAGTTVAELLASDFSDFFSGDDQTRVVSLLKNAVDNPQVIEEDNPVVFKDRHVSMNLLPVEDRENKTLMIIILDVSKRKNAERQLLETKEYLHSVFNTVPAGILIVDAENGNVVDANPHALQLFGVEKEKIVNKACQDFFCNTRKGKCPIFDRKQGGYKKLSQSLTDSNGDPLHVLKSATSCFFNGKEYIVESFFDISEQKKLEDKLHSMAITDELTGLLNRRGFMMMAKKQINIADRVSGRLYLLFADVDNLKWINDTFGHDVGDLALISVARILSSFRSSDIIARLGGDEFAILVSDTSSLRGEKQLSDRFMALLQEENRKKELGFELGISFGVVPYDSDNRCHIEELIAKADKLMYESKRGKKAPVKQLNLPFS